MPHKNNLYNYEIEVYGPEHFEEKNLLLCLPFVQTQKKRFKNANNPKILKN